MKWEILIPVIAAIVALVIGILIGYFMRKKTAEAKINSAEAHAKKIVDEVTALAETKKKEIGRAHV